MTSKTSGIGLLTVVIVPHLPEKGYITNRQKIQALYWLKAGYSPSLTYVAEPLGVHRITVNRWLKQYSVGGLPALLKTGKSTGRHRVIPQAV